MSIFGLTSPKFVYDRGGAGEATVELNNVVRNEYTVETDYVEHVSEIDLNREFISVQKRIRLVWIMNLFKDVDPIAKYNSIVIHKGREVSVWLFRDGVQFARTFDDAGEPLADALFCLKEVTPFFLESAAYRDGLVLVFESVAPGGNWDHTHPPSPVWVQLIDADGLPVYDADGLPVMVKI